jgi:hypothetical protein
VAVPCGVREQYANMEAPKAAQFCLQQPKTASEQIPSHQLHPLIPKPLG